MDEHLRPTATDSDRHNVNIVSTARQPRARMRGMILLGRICRAIATFVRMGPNESTTWRPATWLSRASCCARRANLRGPSTEDPVNRSQAQHQRLLDESAFGRL